MAVEIPVRSDWQGSVVAARTSAGQVALLLELRKFACDNCRYGVHFDTVWGSISGEAHRITWCSSCFNADCARVEVAETVREHCAEVVGQVREQPEALWSGARPAIEDLERRGLV